MSRIRPFLHWTRRAAAWTSSAAGRLWPFVPGQLGRSEEEIAIYDDVVKRYGEAAEPALREQVARALFGKGLGLLALGKPERAADSLCSAWRFRSHLPDHGAGVADALKAIGRSPEDC